MVTLLEKPAALPVSVADLKAHLRLDHTFEDALLEHLLESATNYIEEEIGRALITRTYSGRFYRLEPLPADVVIQKFTLPYAPAREVLGVYRVMGDQRTIIRRYQVRLGGDVGILICGAHFECVDVEYRAGYGLLSTDVPPILRQAITLLAAHMFEFRQKGPAELLPHLKSLLQPFYVRRFI